MRHLRPTSILTFALAAALAASALGACANDAPRAVVDGEDHCAQCHMGVADLRFAAQARTATGKVLLFDSIECLADYLAEHERADFASLHVTDYRTPGTWVSVDSAQFIVDGRITSPMGRSLAAFALDAAPDSLVQQHDGRVIDWAAVQALVASGAVAAPHAHSP